jgi:ubiquinone/menaquinone biosynthesis C-methylase UbiE
MIGPEQSEPDPDELRAEQRDRWERSADGWLANAQQFNTVTMPVSQWLVDAIDPQPGQHVLELAAGIGETGFLAAELLQPGGTLVSSDGAEGMVAHARARAEQLGLRNVEFKPIDLEWIDARTAEFDGVICRWGYMFALDREAALRETRRVLRPGGRVALATWTEANRNPWAMVTRQAMFDAGLIGELAPPSPSPFDLASPRLLTDLLEDTGFSDVRVDEVELRFPSASVEALIEETKARSRAFDDVVSTLDARQLADLQERVAEQAAPYTTPGGGYLLPGVALVAAADA